MTKEELLISQFLTNHPGAALAEISKLRYSEIAQLILDLNMENKKIVLCGLSPRKAARVLEKVPVKEAAQLMSGLQFPILEAIMRNQSEEYRNGILDLLPKELPRTLKRSLSYHKNQVGSHIDSYAAYLQEEMTIESALNYLRNENSGARQHLYVVNKENNLVGYVELTILLTSEQTKLVKSLMKLPPANVTAEMSVKDVLENWNEAFFELPVTSSSGKFLGTLSRQSLKVYFADSEKSDNAASKAGNALSELYMIGLTSLLGGSEKS